MQESNHKKFSDFKKLNLPIGHYAITGSGPLGIRNLREMQDIDIIVDDELWETLAKQYGVTVKNGIKLIVFPDESIEALGELSFSSEEKSKELSINERIAQAEIIDDLPFETLENIILFKRKMGREKDLRDIRLIETWINKNR